MVRRPQGKVRARVKVPVADEASVQETPLSPPRVLNINT